MNPNHQIFYSSPSPPQDPHFGTRSLILTTSPPKPKLISHSPILIQKQSLFNPPSQIYPSQTPYISFQCSAHPLEKARRICSHIHCKKRVLLCEECMLEDPEHVKSHQSHIILIPDFLNRIEEINRKKGGPELKKSQMKNFVDTSSDIVKEIAYNNERYLQGLRSQINQEKIKIEDDFNRIIKLLVENVERSKQKVIQDLDDYYESIQEYSEELKKKALQSSNLEFYMPESYDLQNITRFSLVQKLNEMKDVGLIENYLRKVRDFMFSNPEFEPIFAKEDNICLEMQNLMAEKLKKIYSNPPLYKESSHGHKIFNTFLNKIPVFADELYVQLKDAITFIFIDESQKLFFESVTRDYKSAQLSQINRFNLSHNSFIRTNHSKQINCISVVSPDKLATGSSDSQIMIWDLHTGDHISTFQGHKAPVIALCSMTLIDRQHGLESIGKELYLASGSADKNIILWNMNDENDTIALKGHDDAITCLMDALDGRNLISGSADRKIIVWDVLKGKILTILPCNGSIYYLHFMKDASKFLSCDYSQALNIWKIEYARVEGSNVISKIVLEKVILTKSKVIALNSGYANPNLIIGGCEDKVIRSVFY